MINRKFDSLRRIHWFEILLVLAVLGVHLYAALSEAHNFPNKWFTRDDAFYYFKVAQNISEGHGITFDGINPTNGYHPLWLLACIPIFALARFDLILPLRILLMVMAGLSAATGVFLYRLGKRSLSEFAGIIIASIWTLNLYIHKTVTQLGLESGLTIFAMVLLLYQLLSFEHKWRQGAVHFKDITILTLGAVLLLFSRLDTVFFVLLVGLWIIFRNSPIRYFLLLDMLIFPSSVIIGFLLRLGTPMYFAYTDAVLLMIVLSLAIRIPIFYLVGLYLAPKAIPFWRVVLRILAAVSISSLVIGAVMLAVSPYLYGLPRSALLVDWGLCLILSIASRGLVNLLKIEKTTKVESDPLSVFKNNWHRWLKEGFTYFGILGGSLGAYMLFNRIVIGAAMPVSGSIKRWWGSLPDRAYGGPSENIYDVFGIAPNGTAHPWQLITTPVKVIASQFATGVPDRVFLKIFLGVLTTLIIFITAALLLNRRRTFRAIYHMGLLPLAVGSEIHVLSYNAMGYAASQEWYWISEMLLVVLIGGLIFDNLRTKLNHRHSVRWLANAGAWVISAFLAFGFSRTIISRMPYHTDKPDAPYMEVAAFLEQNTKPGAIIGMTGGGNVGYFIRQRTIVNMDGLINSPQYFQALKSDRGGLFLQEIGMDYIFSNPDILFQSEPYRHQFYGAQYKIINMYGRKALMRFWLPIHQ